jgi:sRNA-binding regulator protein Hfq
VQESSIHPPSDGALESKVDAQQFRRSTIQRGAHLIIGAFFLMMLPTVCYSADNIYLRSGEHFECKVLSIDTSTVTVELLNPSIQRMFYKWEIKVIIYQNGTAETFEAAKPEVQKQESADEAKARLKELEKKTHEMEVKSSNSSGIATGIAICVVIFIVLLIA